MLGSEVTESTGGMEQGVVWNRKTNINPQMLLELLKEYQFPIASTEFQLQMLAYNNLNAPKVPSMAPIGLHHSL